MQFKILDFYRKIEDINPFVTVLKDPTFCILVNKEGKTRELILNLKGDYSFVCHSDLNCFEEEAYKSYSIIKDFLLGINKESKISQL